MVVKTNNGKHFKEILINQFEKQMVIFNICSTYLILKVSHFYITKYFNIASVNHLIGYATCTITLNKILVQLKRTSFIKSKLMFFDMFVIKCCLKWLLN